ncbi:MAG: fatty acid desaturase [Algicola sp.]|nr:fatty acid desaturase [Algicola sp.]
MNNYDLTEEHGAEIRQSMARFPKWTQRFWTWYTCKPLPGQKPAFKLSPVVYLTINVIAFLMFVAADMALVYYQPTGWLVLLVVSWIFTVSTSRLASTVVAHQCMHSRMTGNRVKDKFIADCLSTMVCTESADDYYIDHITLHHKRSTFATYEDPTIVHLLYLGFKPGTPYKQLWRRLIIMLFSPKFHAHFIYKRIKTNFYDPSAWRILGSTVYWAVIIGLLVSSGLWFEFALGVIVPMFFLYHMVALLEFLSEHSWFKDKGEGTHPRQFHVSHSWGRFCGDPLPQKNLSLVRKLSEWTKWTLRAVFYHLPARLTVVPGDLAAHDYHHRYSATFDWTYATYARQADIDNGHEGWPPYSEVWGIVNATRRVFKIISEQEPVVQSDESMPEVSHAS